MSGRLGFKHHRKPWTDNEREVLKSLYPHMGTAKVAWTMLRSVEAIASEAHRLGLKKTPEFMKGLTMSKNVKVQYQRS